MANVITYEEYCDALDITHIEGEDSGWFKKCQNRALNLIRKVLGQGHLVPKDRYELGALKPQFIEHVITGIAEQTKFVYDNDIYFDNGYMNAASAFGVGGYNGGSMDRWNVERIFKSLCPAAYDEFDAIGWTYASLEHPLSRWSFYNKNSDKDGRMWSSTSDWKKLGGM